LANISTQYSGNELNNFLRPNINPNNNRGFEIFDENEKLLFGSTPEPPRSINWENSRIRDVAERLNLIDISTEFYPSSASLGLATTVGVKVDCQRHTSWSLWFKEITKGACLLPDTNILLKRTISSVISPSLNLAQGEELPFKIVIPRLSILELENLANRKGKKGEFFMAFNEIRRLKQYCSLSSPLSFEKISAFNKGAGKQIADALVREEIRSYGQTSEERVIYLTRDMVSALTANAEDLDAIYMAPKSPDQVTLDVGLADIREMIIETATDFGSVDLRWTDNTSFNIEGVGGGKNWFDYFKRRVRVTPI